MNSKTPPILHLRLPKGMILTEQQLIEFSQINHKRIETIFEDDYFTLIIQLMGNFSKATKFTAEIIRILGNWNFIKKLGYLYSETQMYRIKTHTYREADTSFVAFAKVLKEIQDEWEEKIADSSATLLIEISGNKENAKIDLEKTIDYWIPAGTDYVIVVDLEERKWHFFNRSSSYKTYSFSQKFVAPSDLPDLILDFEEIARNCGF
ncbi:MAG: hypothetical protein EAZ97_15255 [Bacteroidetes bacterium]|nr:MAG: hypothetical protein EAZ97_15255 [Bacteroidota bacterium]